jgi:hypothetical protein
LLILIFCRAQPRLVPKIRDLKKLFGELSKNFWYGVEEVWYLGANALGSVVLDTEKFRRADWRASWRFIVSTYLALVGT